MAAATTTGRRARGETPERILDVAERLVQERGFNAVSYADIAAKLGITTASVHYHYPGKAELGRAVIARYRERFMASLAQIDAGSSDAGSKLAAYVELYAGVLRGRRMCLCGMLAAEYRTLPKPIPSAIVSFFDENEAWLARVLDEGRAARTLAFTGPPAETARTIVSSLEGAMLVAGPYRDPRRFDAVASAILSGLAGAAAD
jgi:TetR/AcrR family transcriptional repressor of nem operon